MTQAVWSIQFFFPGGQNGGKEGLSGKLCLWGGVVGAFLSFWGVDLASLVMGGGLTLNPCIDHTGHKSGL